MSEEGDQVEVYIPGMRRVRTNRSELATFLPTPRLIKAFEDLTMNVQEAIPDAIEAGDQVSVNALQGSSLAQSRAESAQSAVDQLAPEVKALKTLVAVDRGQASEIARLTRRLEQMETMVLALARANTENQRLQSRIANLEALVLGV